MSVRRYYIERRRKKRKGYTHNHVVAGILSSMFFLSLMLGFVVVMARVLP